MTMLASLDDARDDSNGDGHDDLDRTRSPSSLSYETTNVEESGGSPPLLELSTTFESASSSSTTTTTSPRECRDDSSFDGVSIGIGREDAAANDGGGNDDDVSVSRHATEAYTAIEAARARLDAARARAERTRRALLRARREHDASVAEARDAESFAAAAERWWGVVNLVDGSDDDSPRSGTFVALGGSADVDEAVASAGEFDAEGSSRGGAGCNDHLPRCLRVSGAGEPMANGRYELCYCADGNGGTSPSAQSPSGSGVAKNGSVVYVRSDGPFRIRSDWHDVCIFERPGYGARARWCVGLVPRSGERGASDRSLQEQEEAAPYYADRNFALAYIFYWMEVDAVAQKGIQIPPVIASGSQSPPSSSKWAACHGARPLPELNIIWEKRWWQFWRW